MIVYLWRVINSFFSGFSFNINKYKKCQKVVGETVRREPFTDWDL